MVALVLEGQHYHTDIDFSHIKRKHQYDLYLGWSFHLGVASDVITYVTAIASLFHLVMAKTVVPPSTYSSLNGDT